MAKPPLEIISLAEKQKEKMKKPDIQSINHPSGLTVKVPRGYEVKNDMLYIIRTEGRGDNAVDVPVLLCRHIPIVTRSFTNVERSQLYYELCWQNNGRLHYETIPAGDIAIRKELLKMADMSLAVNDVNARDMIHYFDRYIMINDIPTNKMVERLGHVKSNFIHPLDTKGMEILPADVGEKQVMEAFVVSGTSEEWIENVFNRIERYPKALLMVIASFTSVILNDLKLGPFIIDLSGVTSKGKTTVLKTAASVWGNDQLVNEWNGTAVSFERKAAFLNSFPLILDDSMKADEKQLQRIIYNYSGGRSKGRGSVVGSQKEFTWNNLLLSTGEVRLTEYAERAGGAAARILPVRGLPFDDAEYHFFDSLYESIDSYYGAVGLEFLKHWQENKEEFLPMLKDSNSLFQKKARGNEVISRIARHYAAIHFTGWLLMKFFNVSMDLGWIETLFDEIMRENTAVDKPLQMLEAILTDLDASRESISIKSEVYQGLKAIYKDGTLFLLPAYLKDFLKFEMNAVRSEWLRRGISLERTEKGKITDSGIIKHLGKNYRSVAINPTHLEKLGYDFSTD